MEKESDTSSIEENEALKKYDKLRQKRWRGTQKKWAGPSHKRFSKYFDEMDSASGSDAEKEKLPPKKSSEKKRLKGPDSLTEEPGQLSSEDDIFTIETVEPLNPKEEKDFPGSDSEPEDPEEVKKFQEKLELHRSRVASVSVVQGPDWNRDNQTMNGTAMLGKSKMWFTQLSEAAHDLLELSSDEEESPGIKFVVKDTDSEEEDRVNKKGTCDSSPTKRVSIIERTNKTSPVKSFTVLEANEESKGVAEAKNRVSIPASSSSKKRFFRKDDSPKYSPKKSFVVPDAAEDPHDGALENKLINEEHLEGDDFQKSLNYTNLPKALRSNRKSTPKPKELVSTKRLTRTRHRSKRNAQDESPIEKLPVSPAKKLNFNSEEKRPRRSSLKKNNVTYDVVAMESKELNLSKPDAPLLDVENVPPFHSEVFDVNSAASNVANQTFSKSILKKDAGKVGPQEDNLPHTTQEDLLPLAIRRQAATVTPIKLKPNRQSSKRSSNSIPLSGEKPSNNQYSLVATPNVSTRSQINKTFVHGEVPEAIPQFLAEVSLATPPSVPHDVSPVPILGTNPVIKFMAVSRLAVEEDPVQHYVLHQNSKFYSVLWKLQPGITSYFRTRGNTWIMVYEGDVKIQHQKERHTKVVQLPAGLTYFVKNVGKSVALFQATEFS